MLNRASPIGAHPQSTDFGNIRMPSRGGGIQLDVANPLDNAEAVVAVPMDRLTAGAL